jgi:hypothetical protein
MLSVVFNQEVVFYCGKDLQEVQAYSAAYCIQFAALASVHPGIVYCFNMQQSSDFD